MECQKAIVNAGARLHAGFHLLPSGEKRFASLGFYLEEPTVRVEAQPLEGEDGEAQIIVDGLDVGHARRLAEKVLAELGVEAVVRIENHIPVHAGLGSTTQVSLSTAAALLALEKGRLPTRGEIHLVSKRLGLGRRSLAGTLLFTHGGVVADAGAPSEPPYRPLFHAVLPGKWLFLLVAPRGVARGLHGLSEEEAFKRLATASERMLEQARRGFYTFLRGLALEDVDIASQGIGLMQAATGLYFSRVQGGVYRADVARLVDEAYRDGMVLAQSSWGPTLFLLTTRDRVSSDERSLRLIASEIGLEVETSRVEPRGYPGVVQCMQ